MAPMRQNGHACDHPAAIFGPQLPGTGPHGASGGAEAPLPPPGPGCEPGVVNLQTNRRPSVPSCIAA